MGGGRRPPAAEVGAVDEIVVTPKRTLWRNSRSGPLAGDGQSDLDELSLSGARAGAGGKYPRQAEGQGLQISGNGHARAQATVPPSARRSIPSGVQVLTSGREPWKRRAGQGCRQVPGCHGGRPTGPHAAAGAMPWHGMPLGGEQGGCSSSCNMGGPTSHAAAFHPEPCGSSAAFGARVLPVWAGRGPCQGCRPVARGDLLLQGRALQAAGTSGSASSCSEGGVDVGAGAAARMSWGRPGTWSRPTADRGWGLRRMAAAATWFRDWSGRDINLCHGYSLLAGLQPVLACPAPSR